jgi:hypothetical protein
MNYELSATTDLQGVAMSKKMILSIISSVILLILAAVIYISFRINNGNTNKLNADNYIGLEYYYWVPIKISDKGFYSEKYIIYKNGEMFYEIGYTNSNKNTGTVKMDIPDELLFEKILKIKNKLSQPETPMFVMQPTEISYAVLLNDNEKIILKKSGRIEQYNKSKYTEDICDYIDSQISELKKQL